MVSAISLAIAAAAALIALMSWWQARRSTKAAEVSASASQASAAAAQQQADAAHQQVRVSREQFEAEQTARMDALQPFVLVDLVMDSENPHRTDLIIENQGPSMARNVRIEVDPPMERSNEANTPDYLLRNWKPLKDGIAALPPGHRIRTFFDSGPTRVSQQPPLPDRYVVTVTCEGPFPNHPPEAMTYELDLAIFKDVMFESRKNLHHLVKETEKVHKGIASLTQAVEKLQP